jgi:hypothetical protein
MFSRKLQQLKRGKKRTHNMVLPKAGLDNIYKADGSN